MDTSKKYYEDKIRDFNKYRRGRTLAQFCKDEGIDTLPNTLTAAPFLTGAVQTKLEIE